MLKAFSIDSIEQDVIFKETVEVSTGVLCDVYAFKNDDKKDLGVIRIQPGRNTPLQKVLKGDKTIEGYLSGKGKLVIKSLDNNTKIYQTNLMPLEVEIKIGELMQWFADKDSELVVYEICYPPYENGRYENLQIL